MTMKIALLTAFIAHILCGYSDCLLSCGAKGRLDFKDIKYPDKMADMFEDMLLLMPTKLPAKGNIAGAAMFLGLLIMI